MRRIIHLAKDISQISRLPKISVDLMYRESADNHEFYQGLVKEFHHDCQKPHPKFPLVRRFRHGVAVCSLPAEYGQYWMTLAGSARRNVKKALRLGYCMEPIQYNSHLADIAEIRSSTGVRQGTMDAALLHSPLSPCTDPPSSNPHHAYPYFGVLRQERLRAYAGCLLAGEACMISHLLGHAKYQPDGIVPFLVTGIARQLIDHCPQVKYYIFGTYFGAGESMRRFKRKFGFLPHCVNWELGN